MGPLLLRLPCLAGSAPQVTSVAMSHVSTSHALIACGCQDPNLRLCDPTSGAITHVFHGHRCGHATQSSTRARFVAVTPHHN